MKKRSSIIFALLIFAGTAGAEWSSTSLRTTTHFACRESSALDKATYLPTVALADEKLTSMSLGSFKASDEHEGVARIPLHVIAEIENIPVGSEELGRIKGGSLGSNVPDSANNIVSAITLWDEVKSKRSLMHNQGENQALINQNIRR